MKNMRTDRKSKSSCGSIGKIDNPLEYIERVRNWNAVSAWFRKAGAHKNKKDKRKSNRERNELDGEEM